MRNELRGNSSRTDGVAGAKAKAPHREPVPWLRVTLSGLLVTGLVLMSSWLFRG